MGGLQDFANRMERDMEQQRRDPREPRTDEELAGRAPIFRNHNCWKCRDGTRPCPNGYRNCEYPRARDD